MSNKRGVAVEVTVSAMVALLIAQAAQAQQAAAAADDGEELEQVVVTGTRVANRSVLDTAVPVDVVSAESLQNLGVTELNQALSVALPSLNFPRPGLADGTDTIRPATLRGLAPDQALVLVNGKRRHTASLVNVNGTVGRGSAAVDLNTLPTAAVRSIEVLRDGASAQYGSDAIAGVINVRMREDRDGGEATLSYGWRDTSYKTLTGTPPAGATWSAPALLERSRNDGETLTVSGWKGFAIGETGYVTVSAEYKDQERTERGGWDFRQQYNRLASGAFDPREATYQRFAAWYGEPELKQSTVFVNAGAELGNGVELYGWASWQDREATSAGFYRPANDSRNVPEIYPDGFLPLISPDVTDYSLAGGARWDIGEWAMDASLVYGYNEMMFTIENTLNRSLGAASKKAFDAGGYDYDQVVLNVSAVRGVEISGLASPLNVAIGLEARNESYSITAGEPDSYRNGGVLLNGAPTASGAQVFPGFRPSNVVDKSRRAVGAYVDLEANLTEKLLGSVALRAEDYSDFGSNVSGKLALRYDITDAFGLRASYSTGFRAPSLQQQYFATTSTNFINGVPFDITTFPVSDPVAVALGAKPLDSEDSKNYSVGAVLQTGGFNLTVDYYNVQIDNRVVLSENLTQANVRAYLQSQGFIGIGGGRFFINGVDTETKGVDVVASYALRTERAGRFDLTATANFNKTDVTRVPATAQLSALNPAPILFNRLNLLTFEKGTPEDKYSLAVNWSIGGFGATLRATRYGDVLSAQDAPTVTAPDFVLTAKTLVDVEARYAFGERFKVAIGADNVLDEYPDPLPAGLNTTGATSFSNLSPFGRSGRFVYGRLTVSF
jgi:iron complex outermembrane receptor protein